jgi:hypothetical protein
LGSFGVHGNKIKDKMSKIKIVRFSQLAIR